MAFWPFGKKKKKQQEKSVESSPLEPKQEQPGAQAPAADAEVAPQTEAAEEASPVEKQETAPAAAPVASAAAGVEALTDYDPVGGSTGPFDGDNVDIEDFDFSDFSDVTLNLGSIRVPLPKESQVQVEMGEQGPKMVHVVTRYGRITPVAFAAPRTGGLWEESSEEIIAGMRAEGMPVEIQQGPWGQEIVGTGTNGVIRIIGVEGPRWLYRVTLAAPTGSKTSSRRSAARPSRALLSTVARTRSWPATPCRWSCQRSLLSRCRPQPRPRRVRARLPRRHRRRATRTPWVTH